MPDIPLTGRRILVVEDDYLVATALAEALSDESMDVIGPAPSVERALACIDHASRVDVAVLDVNLAGEAVYPVADALAARGVPFVLVTGYDQDAIPERYQDRPMLQKPIPSDDVLAAIAKLVH